MGSCRGVPSGISRRLRLLMAGALALCVLLPTAALAEPLPGSPVPPEALRLFEEGRALFAEKRYAEACPKFEQSYRVDPGGGTLLNLALCHELLGKTATARNEFVQALGRARIDERQDRIDLAEEHLRLLDSRLSRLRVVVQPEARTPGLVVLRDGVALGEAAWGEAVPLDPGDHVVEASAPGKLTVRRVIALGPEGDTASVVVEPLIDEGSVPAAGPVAVAPPPPPPPAASDGPPRGRDATTGTAGSTQRTVGLSVGGAGVVALGLGTYFGARALGLMSDADQACPRVDECKPEGVIASRDAVTAANVSGVLFAGGLVLGGVGAYLFFTAPDDETVARLRGAPGVAMLEVAGRF